MPRLRTLSLKSRFQNPRRLMGMVQRRHDDLGKRPRRWFEQKPALRRGPITVKIATQRDLDDFATRGKVNQ